MCWDIAIIGGGIAGITAAIYARRASKTVILIEKESFGGQITLSANVENYPGVDSISGAMLASNLVNQAVALGVNLEIDEVISISKNINDTFVIKTEFGEYNSKAVIIATGLRHRKPDEEGVDRFLSKPNIVRVENSLLTSINGDKHIESITVSNVIDGSSKQISVDGVFAALGHIPSNELFESLTKLDSNGFIIADEHCTTDTTGLFVAGDCRTKAVRQLTTAASDGAIAAISAVKYVDSIR